MNNNNIPTSLSEIMEFLQSEENLADILGMNSENQGTIPEAFKDSDFKPSLAMAYVPWQKFRNIYGSTAALQRGTMFKELDFPFIREEVVPRG